MKTLILSDLHLGSDASTSRRVLDDIRRLSRQCDRVILNGDTLDRYEAADCEKRSAGLIEEANDACTSRNGPPEYLAGNHDPALSTRDWIYLDESRTLIFHGDAIADCTHPSKAIEKIVAARMAKRWEELGGRPTNFKELMNEYRRIQASHVLEYPPIRHKEGGLAYILGLLVPPQKPLQILQYWWHAPKLAAHLASGFDKPVQNVVVGHTHRPGRWKIDGKTVLNTGSYMPLSAPYAVLAEGESVSFRPIHELLKTGRSIFLPPVHGAPVIQKNHAKT